MTSQPSGWYDDPDDANLLRYWDGILWSDRTMPKVKPGLDDSGLAESRTAAAEQVRRPEEAPQRPREASPQQPSGQQPQQDSQQGPGSPYRMGPGAPSPWGPQPAPTTPDGRPLSGWWRRAGAFVLDNLLISLMTSLLTWPWTSVWIDQVQHYLERSMAATESGREPAAMNEAVGAPPWQLLVATLVVYALYDIGLVVWRGRTLGKMVTGISVRPWETPRRPDLTTAARRFAVKSVPQWTSPIPTVSVFGTMFFVADMLWPVRDPSRQTLHDRFAGTVVVVGRSDEPGPIDPQDAPRDPR